MSVDGNESIYLAGRVSFPDFPVFNAINTTFSGGSSDLFITKMNSDDFPPIIQFLDGASDGIVSSESRITLKISDTRSGVKIVRYSWDFGLNYTLDQSYIIDSPIDEGIHHLSLFAEDVAGNQIYQTFSITVDNLAPIISSYGDMNYSLGDRESSIEWTLLDNYLESYFVYKDGELSMALINASNSTFQVSVKLSNTNLKVGVYNFTIVAIDRAGNWNDDTVIVRVGVSAGGASSGFLLLPLIGAGVFLVSRGRRR